ncbi:hypothetical protein R1flu_013541 [Riccia fluitans]|uniref:C3HC-type domain-containing protein n=1 Tax=Riccia fluitans TaxID=41844 RepID=A0ABD1YE96_9MARC
MAEEPEKRFERALSRLFSTAKSSSSPPAPAAGSAGASTPSRVSNIARADLLGIRELTKLTAVSTPSSRPPRAAVSTSTPAHGSQPSCRPWDRGDLLKRLATFKSLTWFGKPQVAGPVACARRGWVNVDVDLLACEGCGARLSFPVPPAWTRVQVDSAAETFAEQLESGHKALCAWKGNACAESLAIFPPAPPSVLLGGYNDRCEALLQLSALPVISSSAVEFMKASRGPQIENILAQPPSVASDFLYENERYVSGARSGEKSETGCSYNNFYQAQRLIALCGWEPRVLPYTVDCDENTGPCTTGRTSRMVGSSDEMKVRKFRDPGPSVLLVSKSEKVDEKQDSVGNKTSPEKNFDPASAVLDCSLCKASVGLWGFSTIRRPSAAVGSGLQDMPVTPKGFPNVSICGTSAASGIHGGSRRRREKATAEQQEEAGEATTTPPYVRSAPRGVLDLSLTIAGGPPPTQLSSPAMIPPAFGPIPGFHPTFGQAEASEVGDWVASYESRGPEVRDQGANQGGSTVGTSNGRPLPADSAEGTVVDHNTDDGEVGKGDDSLKRKRTDSSAVDQLSQGRAVTSGAAVANVDVEPELERTSRKRNKRGQGALTFARQDPGDFPRSSSVNAIDTYYNQKQENSMESVENHREDTDGNETAASGENHDLVEQLEGTETVVQQSGCREAGSGRSVQPVQPGLSKSDEVGCDDGAETNLAVISTGTGTGGGVSVGMGGGSVGMEGSHEAELQGEVNGADFSVHRTHSVAGEVEFVAEVNENHGLTGEFVPDRGVMAESVAEDAEKADVRDGRGDSHEVMHATQPGKRRTKSEGSVEGASGESRGKRIRLHDREQTDDEATVDTTKAVILYGDSALEKEATDGHMAAVTAGENNGCTTVNGPGRGLDELRIWEHESGEFDPIRQHRHFCPWVSVHAAASSSSSAVCGWQLTVEAVHSSLSGGLAETESTASMHKVDPLVSVRKSERDGVDLREVPHVQVPVLESTCVRLQFLLMFIFTGSEFLSVLV